jgi:hypothetical protein
MPIPKFDGIEIPKSDENEIPYCPKCQGKRFLLTETDTVCVRCGNVFAADNVPWCPMKKGEFGILQDRPIAGQPGAVCTCQQLERDSKSGVLDLFNETNR